MPSHLHRFSLATLLAGLSLHAAVAEDRTYFRKATGTQANVTAPSNKPDMIPGTGELRVFGPVQVRARPGVYFELQLGVQDATGAVAWSGSGLPVGLSLSRDGVISGTPTATGSSPNIVLTARDETGRTGSTRPFAVDVRPVPTVTVAQLGPVDAGKAFRLSPTAKDLYGSVSWRVASGRLPVGLALSAENGSITGVAEQPGTFDGITLSVVDADGAVGTSNPFGITVASQISVNGLQSGYGARTNGRLSPVRPYATGGSGQYLWSLASGSGPLPPGVTLDQYGTGISGVPTVAGSYPNISLRIKDLTTGDVAASGPFSFSVADKPAIVFGDTYVVRSGSLVSLTPTVNGLLDQGAWFMNGNVPSNLQLRSTDGRIAGYVDAPGTVQGTTLRVVDLFDGAEATSAPFTTRVLPRLAIAVANHPIARVGTPLTFPAPLVTGLVGAPTLSLSGALPAGLTFDAGTGEIGGTPTAAGSSTLRYTVTDGFDAATVGTGSFTLDVYPATQPVPLAVVMPSSSLKAISGKAFSVTPQIQGSKGSVAWSLAGAAPAWLSVDTATGRLSGQPNAAGTFAGLTLSATDVDMASVAANFSIDVAPADLPSVSMGSLTATAGTAYTSPSPSVSSAQAPLSFSLASGTLPAGLSVAPDSGRVTGTTSESGRFEGISLRMSDATGAVAVSAPLAVTVQPSLGSSTISASMPSTLSGTVGTPFSAAPATAGLGAPLTWSTTTGTLPSWLALDPDTGVLTGTPPAPSSVSGLVLSVRDSSNRAARTNPFAITVTATQAQSVSASIPQTLTAPVGVAFAVSPQVTGATGTQTWTLSGGTLPAGLELVASTGLIRGTPTTLGTTPGLVLTVTDGTGATGATQAFGIVVGSQSLSASLSPLAYSTHAGQSFSTGLPSVASNVGTPSWSISPALPSGLSVNVGTGIVSGTAPGTGTYGPYTLTARDSDGRTANVPSVSLNVVGTPLVSTATGYQARQGFAFAMAPQASNIVGAPRWSLESGTLPDWLTLDPSTGRLSGTPRTLAAAVDLTLRVTDGTGATAVSQPFGLSVGTSLSAATDAAAYRAREGHPFSTGAPVANGAQGAVTWSLGSGALPAWLRLDARSGVLSSTSAGTGSFPLALKATDAGGGTALTPSFDVTGYPALSVSVDSASVRKGSVLSLVPRAVGAYGGTQWSLGSGTLPAGVGIVASTGALSGRATQVTPPYPLTLTVRDADGISATSAPFTVEVTQGLTVSGLPERAGGRISDAFTLAAPTVSNAQGAVSWQASGLPAGIARQADNSLSGTPTSNGSYPVTFTATDASDGAQGSAGTTLVIAPAMRVIGTVPDVMVHAGSGFSTVAPGVIGQRGTTLEWASGGAALPPGASVASGTGILSAPSTSVVAVYPNLAVKVTDPVDGRSASSAPFTVSVLDAPYVADTPTSYTARFGSALRTSPPTLGNRIGTATWAWAPGVTPPSWASIDPATGSITGQVSVFANTPNLALTGRDGTGASARSVNFSLNVYSAPAVTLSDPATSKKLRVGDAYVLTPTPTGVAGSRTWSLASTGPLPAGLGFDPTTGVVSGTATAPGSATFSLNVTDSSDGATAKSADVTLNVQPALTLSGLQPNYSVRSGGFIKTDAPVISGVVANSNVTYSVTAITLPSNGLSFNASTGVIQGLTNGSLARRTATLTATNDWDNRTASTKFDIGVLGPLAVSGSSQTVIGRNDTDIALSAYAAPTPSNNVGTVTWSKGGGTWPAWLDVDSATGRLKGTPTGYASNTSINGLTLRGIDVDGSTALGQPITVTINAAMAVSVNTTSYTTRVNVAKSVQPNTPTGTVGSVSWSYVTRSGTPPATVTQNATSGIVTFTATQVPAQPWVFAIRATDSAGGATADTQDITTNILGAFAISQAPTLSVRFTGVGSSTQPQVANALGTPTWSVQSSNSISTARSYNSCPQCYLSVGANGVISVATDNTTQNNIGLTLKATDTDGSTATVSLPMTLTARPTYTGPTTFRIRRGVAYASDPIGLDSPRGPVSLGFSGSVDYPVNMDYAYYYACGNGAPSGYSFTNGRMTGTASLSLDTWSTCIASRDTGDNAYAITAVSMVSAAPLTLTGIPSNVTLTVGKAYSSTVTAANGQTIAWTSSGNLPPNVALTGSGATRTVSGTPTATGTYGYTVTVTDSWDGSVQSLPVTFTVVDSVGTATMANTSTRVTANLVSAAPVRSDPSTTVNWASTGTALPAGLTVEAATGSLKGRPTATGTTTGIRLTGTASNGGTVDTNTFQVTVAAAPTVSLPSSNLAFHSGVAGSYQATATGIQSASWGKAKFDGTGTAWPAGLTVDANGRLTGTLTAAASGLAVYVTDGDGAYASAGFSTSITAPLSVALNTVPASSKFHAGRAGSVTGTPSNSGRIGTVSYDVVTVSGTAPSGVSVNAATGAVSFTSGSVGTWVYALRATDGFDQSTAQSPNVTVQFLDDLAASYSPSSMTVRYNSNLALAGLTPSVSNNAGTVSYSWKSGQPSGWILNTATGAITGTSTQAAGTTTPVVTASDGTATSDMPLTLTSTAGVDVAYPTLRFRVGKSINAAMVPTNLVGAPTYSLSSGAFPNGVTMSSAGAITGTPLNANAQSPTVRLSDASDQSFATKAGTFTAVPALTASAPNTTTFYEGMAFDSVTVNRTGVGGTAAWSASGLPDGVTLNPATGVLSGTPAAGTASASPYPVQVTLTDGYDGQVANASFNVAIGTASAIYAKDTLPDGVNSPCTGGSSVAPYYWAADNNLSTNACFSTGSASPVSLTYSTAVVADCAYVRNASNTGQTWRLVVTNADGTTQQVSQYVSGTNAAVITLPSLAANVKKAELSYAGGATDTYFQLGEFRLGNKSGAACLNPGK